MTLSWNQSEEETEGLSFLLLLYSLVGKREAVGTGIKIGIGGGEEPALGGAEGKSLGEVSIEEEAVGSVPSNLELLHRHHALPVPYLQSRIL